MFGNIANTHYRIAKVLRTHTRFDVHVYLDPRHHATMRPENDDPELAPGYPQWIHLVDILGPRRQLAPWTSPVVSQLSRYDLVVASGEGPIFAQFSDAPWVFYVTGADLTLLPFPLRYWHRHRTARAKVANLVLAFWQRRAIRRAREVWSQPFAPLSDALRSLGVDSRRVAPEYFPLPMRTAEQGPDGDVIDDEVRQIRHDHDFIVFHPSRMLITADPALRATGQWKRNDMLFRAFATFLRTSRARSPLLLLIDRPDQPDAPVARRLIDDLGIASSVQWLRPPGGGAFARDRILELYRASDVVADDFGVGWFGAVALEALAVGRPLVTYVDEPAMRELYPWHPMISCANEAALTEQIAALHAEPGRRRQLGLEGRRWIEEFHSEAAVAKRYDRNIRKALERLRP